ncbi:MAG: recombinase family protein [Defluviitaleaceae bacterium]|nr:recombinase family protein [Defluviitaleaceae bacterium]MCL2275476.1 recombinase family protein [Defluviitaleaceae bacterium]
MSFDEKTLETVTQARYNAHAVNEANCPKGELPMRQSQRKITALYERLSREDDDVQGQSNSIINQKQLLSDYAKAHGFTNIRHYTDDGTSGVRFDREAWNQLIADIEAGKIGTLLCKDMSRIGREHVQVGAILERLRVAGVRFIAVGNSIDSAQPESMEFAPFINIINEFYARDISRKITAAKHSDARNGKYASAICPYGYRKSTTEKGVWEIDPEAAEVVRRIYQMVLEGYSAFRIAKRLRVEKILSPAYYMAERNIGAYKNKPTDNPYRWQARTIDDIVTRMENKGCMVNLKTRKQSFKDKRGKKQPKDEWLVFEDKHPPIVDEATWQAANDIREKTRRKKSDDLGEPHALSGVLYCETCKSKMHHNRGINKSTGERFNFYTCKKSKLEIRECTDHRVHGAVLEELVLKTLQRVSRYATANEADFTRQINELYANQQADTVKSQRKKLATNQRRHNELDTLIQRIYEDNVSGKLSEKRYEVLANQYEQEQFDLEEAIAQLEADLAGYDDSRDRAAKFLELTRRYRDFTELTPAMLLEFVDRIEIHERAEKRVRVTTQKIDIYLNFIGTYTPPVEDDVLAVNEENAGYEKTSNPDDLIFTAPLETAVAQDQRMAKMLYQREYKKRRKANGGKPLLSGVVINNTKRTATA